MHFDDNNQIQAKGHSSAGAQAEKKHFLAQK